jgi:hypothetical protein
MEVERLDLYVGCSRIGFFHRFYIAGAKTELALHFPQESQTVEKLTILELWRLPLLRHFPFEE